MKNLICIIIFAFLSFNLFGQVQCGTIYTNNKDAVAPYCGTLSSYRPDNPYIIDKYIRVNLHIMQKANGTDNFQANNPQHMAYLNAIIPYINGMLRNIEQPYYGGATGDYYIVDTKIQLVLKGIYFHQDNVGWENNFTNTYQSNQYPITNRYCYDNYKINDDTELNIFFIEGIPSWHSNNGIGAGQGLNGELSNYIVEDGLLENYQQYPPDTFGSGHLGGSPWIKNPHLLHEIGHCLNLIHTHDAPQFSDTYFPQNTGWCSPATDYHCTNNVMSYSSTKTFLSPMQLEFLHKELTFSWRKKLVANCEKTINYPIVVNQNENWDYAISIADVLTVTNAATVDVSCKFDFVENSIVTIDQFSTLNFNSAAISTCKNCLALTFNVAGNLNFNNTPFVMPPNSILNITSTGVVNINNADGLCINQGGQINIASGGQLFINSQDYTSIVTNGYNNVYDKFISNQPVMGSFYALNKIETSGLVTSLPNQLADFVAGRKIVLNQRFVGYPGFHASIDKNINNCIETPCGSGMRMGNPSNNNNSPTYVRGNPSIKPYKNSKIYQIKVLPNPNAGQFTIVLDNANGSLIEIYAIMGKKVWSKNAEENKLQIDISNQPKGIYLVKVVNGNTVTTQKIVYQ